MVKSNVSELVALGMNETLENEEFKSLFGVAYKKTANCHENHEHTAECGDASYADDNNADMKPPVKPQSFDPNFGATPVPGPNPKQPGALSADDNNFADDADDNDADDDADDNDDDEDDKKSTALDAAIEGLLTASAALDSVGFDKSATTTLNLAGLIVEAKKKVEDKKKKKKDKKKGKNPFAKGNSSGKGPGSSGSGSTDSNDARDKAKAKEKAAKEKEKAAKEKAKEKEQRDTQMAKDKAAKEKAKEKAEKEKAKAKADKEKADKAKKSSK